MSNSNNSSRSGGIGFAGLLTIAFIVLKLTHFINWSWWWVLAPSWIPSGIMLIILLVWCVAAVIVVTVRGGARARRQKNDLKELRLAGRYFPKDPQA